MEPEKMSVVKTTQQNSRSRLVDWIRSANACLVADVGERCRGVGYLPCLNKIVKSVFGPASV